MYPEDLQRGMSRGSTGRKKRREEKGEECRLVRKIQKKWFTPGGI
jgi:hypothetical protein